MARNRGKRPGTASESTSRSQNQDEKAGNMGAKSNLPENSDKIAAASSAIAAKIDPPATGPAKTAPGGPTSSQSVKADVPAKSLSSGTTAASSTSSMATGTKATAASATKETKPAGSPTSGPKTSGPKTTGNTGGPPGTSPANGGFWPGLIGGVIGGAATALAASLFWTGADDGDATTALESRLAAAEQQVGQVTDLSERIAAVEAAPATATDGSDELRVRLDELETKLAGDEGASTGTGDDGAGERLAALEQRIESLTADLQSASEAQQASVATLASVESVLPTFENTLAATGKTVEEASSRTSELSEAVETLNGEVQTLTSRIGETESRLDHVGGEYQRGAAMIVAIGDVDRAITRAEPFDSALQSLKLLLRDDAVLGEILPSLEPMAEAGVPTSNELKSEFGEMASRVLLAETGDQSLADQVGDNVFGIFNIRPSGADVEGGDSRAILARAQASLSDDDLEGALDELGGLEGAAAETAGPWIERVRAKLSAEAAIGDLRAHAQALVAKGT